MVDLVVLVSSSSSSSLSSALLLLSELPSSTNPRNFPSRCNFSFVCFVVVVLLPVLFGTSTSLPITVQAWIPPSLPLDTTKSFLIAIANGPFPSCPSYNACKQFDNPYGIGVSRDDSNSAPSIPEACTFSIQSISSPSSKSPKYKFPRALPQTTNGYKSIAIRRT